MKLLALHEKGVIDDNALNKALNALKEPTSVGTIATLDNLRKRRRNKKQRKRQQKKYAAVLTELKQQFDDTPTLVDKTLCGYLKAYKIPVGRYKDPRKLLKDRKNVYKKNKIVHELNDLGGLKFSLGLKVKFTKDEKKIEGTFYSKQQAVLSVDTIDELYMKALSHIDNSIEIFQKEGSDWVISKCVALYLNIAKL